MNRRYATAGAALSLALLGVGCDSFLSGPGLNENPNSPIEANLTARFVATQASAFTRLEGQVARFAGIFTQQLIGSNNQQQLQGTQYGVSELDVSGFMSGFYTGGGLSGLRQVQALASEADDPFIEGVAKVWEAYTMGTAASVWGDLPYSEAVNPEISSPKLDPQLDIYEDVLALLDEAIALIQADTRSDNCLPAEGDLVYCPVASPAIPRATQRARWIRAANTLKARFNLHLVEREGATRYQAAITAANLGINEAPANASQAIHGQALGDFRALHGSTTNVDANIWAQFLQARQDIVAGHALVGLLKARNDPRLTAYFDPNSQGHVWGMNADGVEVTTGCAAGAPGAPCRAPAVVSMGGRRANTFRQPLITWAENQLILAEAKHATGDVPGATTHVNNVRVAVGLLPLATATFQDVMEEKYIAMFQNIDVWSDFKRTCIPLVKPYLAQTEVLGRLPYGSAERTSNPNLPLPSAYPQKTTGAGQLRNWNDPAACPRP